MVYIMDKISAKCIVDSIKWKISPRCLVYSIRIQNRLIGWFISKSHYSPRAELSNFTIKVFKLKR